MLLHIKSYNEHFATQVKHFEIQVGNLFYPYTVPASSTVVLTDHKGSPSHNPKEYDYRQVIGKLLYLEKLTRSDISCAVHQCARHCIDPKVQHTIAVKRIGRYLLATKDKGLIM